MHYRSIANSVILGPRVKTSSGVDFCLHGQQLSPRNSVHRSTPAYESPTKARALSNLMGRDYNFRTKLK